MIVIAREKEITFSLLINYKIEFISLSSHKKSYFLKAVNYLARWIKTYRICKKIKPDISIGIGDFILPQVSRLLHFKSIVFTDIESVIHDPVLTFPFASKILTPKTYIKDLGHKQIRINSYKECAYINDNFCPDPLIFNDLGIDKDEKYIVIRFVSHASAHDIGYKGIIDKLKLKAVNILKQYAEIFISSEDPLPDSLKKYQLCIRPEKIHSVLYYSSLVYGESSTMAAEAALMGTPAIFIDNNNRGYTKDIELKSGLLFNFTLKNNGLTKSLEKGMDIIKSDIKKTCNPIKGCEDISEFIINFLTYHGNQS